MSFNENPSADSESSSDSLDFNELDEWKKRVAQQNHQIDRMIENVIINNPALVLGDHTPRARRRYCERDREIGEERLMNDYFRDMPTYNDEIFRRRFRMRKSLFLRIVEAVTANDEYFQQRPDATGRMSLSPLQKCTGAMRVLAYGTSVDAIDEYLRMSATVIREALISFVEGVISFFGDEYLRRPNGQDLARLLHVRDERGFPGTCNDINVLHRSPVFSDVLEGRAPNVSYIVNGRINDRAYYLTDGIYPSWAAFVKSITSPQLQKHKLFAQHQEATRKDVERAFGVLQARFAFIRNPCLVWDKSLMGKIMMACIIMHNMIVEDERDTYQNYYDPTEFFMDNPTNDDQRFQYSTERIASLSTYMINREQLRNREAHTTLKNDLIEHIWQKFGAQN